MDLSYWSRPSADLINEPVTLDYLTDIGNLGCQERQTFGTGEVKIAWWEKYLLCQHEDLSFDPGSHIKEARNGGAGL